MSTVIHPSRVAFRAAMATTLAYGVPLFATVGFVAIARYHGGLPIVLVALLMLGAVIASVALFFRNASLTVSEALLTRRDAFGILRDIPIAGIASVVIARRYERTAGRRSEQLFLLDARGRRLLRVHGETWQVGAVDEVVGALLASPTVIEEPIQPGQFARRYPGTLRWFEIRPAVLGMVIVLIVIGVATVLALGAR